MHNGTIPESVRQSLKENKDVLLLQLSITEAEYVQWLVKNILLPSPNFSEDYKSIITQAALHANDFVRYNLLLVQGLLGSSDGSRIQFPGDTVKKVHTAFLMNKEGDAQSQLVSHYIQGKPKTRFFHDSVPELKEFI